MSATPTSTIRTAGYGLKYAMARHAMTTQARRLHVFERVREVESTALFVVEARICGGWCGRVSNIWNAATSASITEDHGREILQWYIAAAIIVPMVRITR
jgi:hypothetical protein